MEILKFRSLVVFLIHLFEHSSSIDFDEGCFVDKEPIQLQVAFVLDQTGTFFDGGSQSFIKEFARLAPELMEAIDDEYPGTEFALTLHADWERSAEPEYQSGSHNNREYCYEYWVRFITDRKLFQTWLNKVERRNSGHRENALAAVAFTASASDIRWIRNATTRELISLQSHKAPFCIYPKSVATTADGKLLRRVIVLVTDRDSGPLNKPGRRRDFRGDGTDTCQTSKPPTHEILRNILEKYEMSVIALLGLSDGSGDLIKIYQDHFEKIGGNIPYCARAFTLKQRNRILTRSGKIPEDFWKNQKEMFELEEKSEQEGYKEESSDIEERALEARVGKFDDVIKHVLDCLRQTKAGGCVYGDPEGVNTLGL